MQTIRKYLLPTVMPFLIAARVWLVKTFDTSVDPSTIDLFIIGATFALMSIAWCIWFRTLSQMTWQMIIGVSMGLIATILTQIWLIAIETVLTVSPAFFFTIGPLIGNRTSALLANVSSNLFTE